MNETDKLKVEMYDEVVKEKNKEYIELTCRFRETFNDIKNKDKEIERLNNIINELEKALDENVELTYIHNGIRQFNKTLTEGGLLFRDYIKSKLQELKGSDKND